MTENTTENTSHSQQEIYVLRDCGSITLLYGDLEIYGRYFEAADCQRQADYYQRQADDWQREADDCQRQADYWQRRAGPTPHPLVDWRVWAVVELLHYQKLLQGEGEACRKSERRR